MANQQLSDKALNYRDNILPSMSMDDLLDQLITVTTQNNNYGERQEEVDLVRAEIKKRAK